MLARILSVLLAVPLVLGLLLAPWSLPFKLLVQLCAAVALNEFFLLAKFPARDRVAGVVLGTLHGTALLYLPVSFETGLLEFSALVIIVFGWFLFAKQEAGTVPRIGPMVFGLCYVGTLTPLIGLLRGLPDGVRWVFLLLALTWLNDTFAYFSGHWWGRRKLAPQVSPGKTWEGLWGGFAGSFIGLIGVWWLGGRFFPLAAGFFLALVSGVLGPLGDLAESLLKRGADVKDSGRLIPGHGGMLDRIDALLFNAPVVYGFALYYS